MAWLPCRTTSFWRKASRRCSSTRRLALRLKTMEVDSLVFAGVATDIGIEFNCRHAAALGYYTVVAEDASGAYTQEAHERSLSFLRGWTTPVVSADTICQVWRSEAAAKPL